MNGAMQATVGTHQHLQRCNSHGSSETTGLHEVIH